MPRSVPFWKFQKSKSKNKMLDRDIREYLKSEFKQCLFVDEVNVGDARVDLLDLSSELHGYEIKSDGDNYSRLANQVKNYNRFLSRITIVVGHDKIHSVKSVVPDFWGIIAVYKCPAGIIRHEQLREACPNPYFDKKYALTSLWKRELMSIVAKKFGVKDGNGRYAKMRRWKLASILQKEVSQKEAIKIIRNCYIERLQDGWR